MIDMDALADALMTGGEPGAEMHWLRTEVAGLTIGYEPSPAALRFRAMAAVDDYWQSLPKTEGVAEVMKVDPMQIAGALGSVMLIDVVDDGRDFRYAIYGSRIAEISGFDMTGKWLSDIPTSSPIATFFHSGYLGVVRHRRRLFTIHQAPANIMIGFWHRLILPLGQAGQVRRLLVCNVGARPDGVEK